MFLTSIIVSSSPLQTSIIASSFSLLRVGLCFRQVEKEKDEDKRQQDPDCAVLFSLQRIDASTFRVPLFLSCVITSATASVPSACHRFCYHGNNASMSVSVEMVSLQSLITEMKGAQRAAVDRTNIGTVQRQRSGKF